MPAAKLISRCSGVRCSVICSMSTCMSCGFTVSTRVPAHRTASGFERVVETCRRSASSEARSSRRAVTMISSADLPPERIKPATSASPIRPPPRRAILRSFSVMFVYPLDTSSSERVRYEEPYVGRPLRQPPRQIGIPLAAVRYVHADRLALADQGGLQVAADPVEHLE